MEKSFEICNKCHKNDSCALIHCVVCAYPFHVKCIAPKLTVKACDDLVANSNFHFYCDDHSDLCVHKLLNRISKLERKFRPCIEPLTDISKELDTHQLHLKNSGYNTAAKPNTKDAAVSTSPSRGRESLNLSSQPVEKRGSLSSNITIRRKKNHITSEVEHNGLPNQIHGLSSDTIVDVETQCEAINPISTASQSSATLGSKAVNNNILTTVNPSRNVFLSGLSPDTTEEQVNLYINTNYEALIPVNVKKMRLKEDADHSSFIILTGRNKTLFENLVKPSFWPSEAIVHQFVAKENFRNGLKIPKRIKPSLPHPKKD
jgi:hypothetical protein